MTREYTVRTDVEKAASIILNGGLVAVPTETVYGLAADATNGQAVASIFAAKGRPAFNPLICHVSSIDMAKELVEISPLARSLMKEFWPGPLTFVLPKQNNCPVSDLVSADLDTLAVRLPNHDITRQLITALDRPIAAPSANISGKISPTTAGHVKEGLGNKVDMILDGGDCTDGIESTIITIQDDTIIILRPGSVTIEILKACSGKDVVDYSSVKSDKIIAPGQLTSHYAPESAVRLNVSKRNKEDFLIGFGDIKGDVTLSESGDLIEAATNLFKALRDADKMAKNNIAIAPIPNVGIGVAINDRLKRAAAPRE